MSGWLAGNSQATLVELDQSFDGRAIGLNHQHVLGEAGNLDRRGSGALCQSCGRCTRRVRMEFDNSERMLCRRRANVGARLGAMEPARSPEGATT